MFNYLISPRRNNYTTRSIWNDFFTPSVFNSTLTGMRTDISENEKEYVLDIELAGYDKNEVKISFEDGYLTVKAEKSSENNDEDNSSYITRERYMGTVSRSWYVGNIDKEQIKASFNNGILTVTVPKEQLEQEETKYITIE